MASVFAFESFDEFLLSEDLFSWLVAQLISRVSSFRVSELSFLFVSASDFGSELLVLVLSDFLSFCFSDLIVETHQVLLSFGELLFSFLQNFRAFGEDLGRAVRKLHSSLLQDLLIFSENRGRVGKLAFSLLDLLLCLLGLSAKLLHSLLSDLWYNSWCTFSSSS